MMGDVFLLVLGFLFGACSYFFISLKNEKDLRKWYEDIIEDREKEIMYLMYRRS